MKVALFDLDGTLLRTPQMIITEMTQEAYQVTGVRPDHDAARRQVGRPLLQMALALAGGNEAQAQLIVTGYRRRYLERIVPAGPELVYPGVHDGLRHLGQDGWRIGVVTNKSHGGALEILGTSGLAAYLDVVIGADDVPDPKPDPAPVFAALKQLHILSSRAVMIGDTVHDIHAGQRAGADTIGVTHGVGSRTELKGAGATWVVDDFPAVLDTLRRASFAAEPPTVSVARALRDTEA